MGAVVQVEHDPLAPPPDATHAPADELYVPVRGPAAPQRAVPDLYRGDAPADDPRPQVADYRFHFGQLGHPSSPVGGAGVGERYLLRSAIIRGGHSRHHAGYRAPGVPISPFRSG